MAKGSINVISLPRNRIYIPKGNDLGYDDEFNDGSINSAWIAVNKSGYENSWYEPSGLKGISVFSPAGKGAFVLTGLLKSLGSLSYPIYIETAILAHTKAFNYPGAGLVFTDGVTYGSGIQVASFAMLSNVYTTQCRMTGFNNRTAYTDVQKHSGAMIGPLYLRFVWESANQFSSYFSPDGVVWMKSHDSTSYTITPTHCGIACINFDASTYDTLFNFLYFRVRSGLPANG